MAIYSQLPNGNCAIIGECKVRQKRDCPNTYFYCSWHHSLVVVAIVCAGVVFCQAFWGNRHTGLSHLIKADSRTPQAIAKPSDPPPVNSPGMFIPASAKALKPKAAATTSCLERNGPLLVLTGARTTPELIRNLKPGTRIDARSARWANLGNVPFRISGGPNVCVEGGEISGQYPLSTSWAIMHDTYAVEIRGGSNYLLSNMRIHNYGDGVFIGKEDSEGFVVSGAYLTQIRDDAISDDYGWSGTIEDTLIDGTYVGFSDRGFTAAKNDAVLNIRNTILRLRTYTQTYNNRGPGHGWFWKWDNDGIRLSLHGNIFFAESASLHSGHQLLPEKVVTCKRPDGSPDNIIVWGGRGPYPRPKELETGCFTLTTDTRVWYAAVRRWLAAHKR